MRTGCRGREEEGRPMINFRAVLINDICYGKRITYITFDSNVYRKTASSECIHIYSKYQIRLANLRFYLHIHVIEF